ncbi:MAG: hypothetical protein WEC54_05525 [Gemmatimonadales bacterium]
MIEVGRVQVMHWPGDVVLATNVAEAADAADGWPGLPTLPSLPMRIVLTRSDAQYDSVTRGRLPSWSGAAAFPDQRMIVLKVGPDLARNLRHELAHLALRQWTRSAPLWFEEGYAARAAGEWGRLDALTLNWALLTGRTPTYRELDRALRAGPSTAPAAYGLATAAVVYLEALGGARGLAPLLANLRETGNFDRAVRRAHLLTVDQLEEAWRTDTARRYGWLRVLTSLGLFWAVTAVAVGVIWWQRRGRDRVRKAALAEGWEISEENDVIA